MKLSKRLFLLTFMLTLSGCTAEDHEGVAIYLIANDIRPHQLSTLNHLELADSPFLAEEEIVSYRKATHDIVLTKNGIEKIQKLAVPVNGTAFAICVNHKPIYTGAFWRDYSSISYDGVVINTTRVSQENPTIRIQLGYPDSSFYRGEDPRADPSLLEELEKAGKLK